MTIAILIKIEMLQQIFKTIQSFFLRVVKFPWIKALRYSNVRSKNIVIFFPDYPRDFLKYFYSDAFINDMALVKALVINKIDFKVKIGSRSLNKVNQSNVFFNMGKRFRSDDTENYSDALIRFSNQMLSQKNICFPPIRDVFWWENKSFMHKQFEKLGVNDPPTTIIKLDSFDYSSIENKEFPYLVKEVHSSGSLGVYKVDSVKELIQVCEGIKKKKIHKEILIQDLLEMDRDLRVIIVGNKILLHYWRINLGDEWKPTSTKHGSDVDFIFFPKTWKEHVLNIHDTIGLHTSAFDLVWENNDYSKPPIVLEVSPSFQPNPAPPSNLKYSYGQFKTSFRFRNSYSSSFINTVDFLKQNLVEYYVAKKILIK